MTAQLIAVIDNDIDVCDLVCEILADEGYRTVAAHSGDTAYALIQDQRPAAVILDIHLAGASGLTLIELLRAQPATVDIPIIVCSADGQLLERHAGELERLTCVVLTKPFDIESLVDAVEKCMTPPTLEAVA